jgi:uncharacterized protein (TIGR02301 family)
VSWISNVFSSFRTASWPRVARRGLRVLVVGGFAVMCATAGLAQALQAAPNIAQDSKPYDDKLLRLAEILGAVHYLRELCSANDGQLWRDRMKELLDTEGSTALRKARLTRSFNQGYRSYRRTYVTCTPTAQTSIERFLSEGIQIGDGLVQTAR